jgi:hypothetical protein
MAFERNRMAYDIPSRPGQNLAWNGLTMCRKTMLISGASELFR